MGRRTHAQRLAFVAAAIAIAGGAPIEGKANGGQGACRLRALSPTYVQRVDRALRAKQDVWGNELLSARSGPTYEGVQRYVAPLLLAGAQGQAAATESGVHYVALAQPDDVHGAGTVALHVADGSQILSNRLDGPRLTIGVGRRGAERPGACLSRLSTPGLFAGYLPLLETSYVDSDGVRYRQELFAARIPQTRSLVSFVEIVADARRSAVPTEVRLTPSERDLVVARGRLIRGNSTYLYLSPGGRFDGSSVSYAVEPHGTRTVYLARLVSPSRSEPLTLDGAAYEAARKSVVRYWQRRLSAGATIVVPERRVLDARQNLLIQNLMLTWRYSIGNPYEEFSFPEGIDVAEVMSAQGFAGVARAILETSLTRPLRPYPNWKMGQKLVGSALYYRLFRDRSYVDRVTPVLREYVDSLGRQIDASPRGMLQRERYSSDIPDSVYGLHSQAVVWQGLRSMGKVWEQTGHVALAARSRSLARVLEKGLWRAVRESERRLRDGSLFIPVRLLDREPVYDALTASRPGSYWNLVAPYAFASGFFPPRSPEAEGALRYMLRHGSRLLGLVRAGAYALYGKVPVYPASGTDQVYGLNVSRFLADNDRPDQLVLSLYGQLAAAMTPGTFVSGEAASIAPLGGRYHRSMYLPPNGASNGTFLETLRLMLVHETRGKDGEPRGLELAYATPRAWLRAGQRIAVRRLPTSFGPLSFTIRSTDRAVRISLDVPQRAPLSALSLRLRLPQGDRISSVVVNGRPVAGFSKAETFALPHRPGHLEVVARVSRS
jgi:hypothetical protein